MRVMTAIRLAATIGPTASPNPRISAPELEHWSRNPLGVRQARQPYTTRMKRPTIGMVVRAEGGTCQRPEAGGHACRVQ